MKYPRGLVLLYSPSVFLFHYPFLGPPGLVYPLAAIKGDLRGTGKGGAEHTEPLALGTCLNQHPRSRTETWERTPSLDPLVTPTTSV